MRDAAIEVIHVWSPPAPVSGIASVLFPREVAPYELAAKELLERSITEALDATPGPRTIVPKLCRGYPSTELLVEVERAQLLVVGTRGRGGFRGLLLGSVSQQCAAHSPAPVAVIPEDATVGAEHGDVVVGVDGSPGSRAALCFALREAACRDAKLRVVNAWQFNALLAPADYRYAAINQKTFTDDSRELVHRAIDDAVATTGVAPKEIDPVTTCQPPVQALLDRCAPSDLLVVGTRGRGGFTGLLLGSVSQHCLHHARGAVTVVHPEWKGP